MNACLGIYLGMILTYRTSALKHREKRDPIDFHVAVDQYSMSINRSGHVLVSNQLYPDFVHRIFVVKYVDYSCYMVYHLHPMVGMAAPFDYETFHSWGVSVQAEERKFKMEI